VISELDITGNNSMCINLVNCSNIKIEYCVLHSSKQVAINLYNCKNITIRSNYIHDVASGVLAAYSSVVTVDYNQFKNMKGPYPNGQIVQFNNVTGAGNQVNYNRGENISGQSSTEDLINMYQSTGTASQPIQIYGNWLRGGGPSNSGGGIMLGDNGGQYMIAQNNVLVNPGMYGIAISSGNNIQIVNNKIYSKQLSFSKVGIYIWNQYKSACALNVISGNQVKWINASGEEYDNWNDGNCGTVAGWSTNIWGAKLDSTLLPSLLITQ
jgi:parallel beta-helix repeat protein